MIILLDEYDTPMQDAYVNGYWEKLIYFLGSAKNPYFQINNLKVVTTTSDEYADCFGFTGGEVFQSLDEYGRGIIGRSKPKYELTLTNREVHLMIQDWFSEEEDNYNAFIKALLLRDIKAMNLYMDRVALQTFSYFDTRKNPPIEEPECFYHGFVLGLMVELADRYVLTSNRENGFGRYDVMLEPLDSKDNAIILEFKVQDTEDEKELSDTVAAALQQIDDKNTKQPWWQKASPKRK